ncbi:MAG TPA: metalloregulator ArsR/SmtB family transcription factor [Leptospiraceae bacterium]|nr:metalloregulator ArsR/SmtB family transcription factor [Leptospiraceae bacterium]HMY68900.1 metalloregulator ArsR/SmtB family transcription factor [Leptospiraceae bacterium]HNF13090.1 metalloregulator ArsR/SmtB family transcription factor [Leptospiraceae bacterium]HNF23078.1 metalloregulator ArsR/SmtB family transcription factor [Leptospiraceae bacterium]HNH07898.1 metalloregulator ArsR/SmtB family transcription factor [Leptospiraceae bacterium]
MSNAKSSSAALDAVFTALADPTRRAILARLAKGESTVTQIARPFKMSQPAISRHLKVLEQAGLISTAVRAQERPRRLETAPLKKAADWIEKYRQMWEDRYQALDGLLEELQKLQTQGSQEQ